MIGGRPALLQALSGGDRRSTGEADRVVEAVLASPDRLGEIVAGFDDKDPVVRARASDVAEKVSRVRPNLLAPHKAALVARMAEAPEKEVRWHLAQIAPRLPLDAAERSACAARLVGWLADESRIVQASALSALAELSEGDPVLRRRVARLAGSLARAAAPAVRARARIVLARLRALQSP